MAFRTPQPRQPARAKQKRTPRDPSSTGVGESAGAKQRRPNGPSSGPRSDPRSVGGRQRTQGAPRYDVYEGTPGSVFSTRSTGTSNRTGADTLYICAVVENRACEVGIAAIDLRTNHMMLTQVGDSQTYTSTLAMLAIYDPKDIVMCEILYFILGSVPMCSRNFVHVCTTQYYTETNPNSGDLLGMCERRQQSCGRPCRWHCPRRA